MFWAPSNGYSGNIRFEATVAESYDVYWNNVNSKYVNIGDAPEIEENAAAGVGALGPAREAAAARRDEHGRVGDRRRERRPERHVQLELERMREVRQRRVTDRRVLDGALARDRGRGVARRVLG